jgi:hypothetical protein
MAWCSDSPLQPAAPIFPDEVGVIEAPAGGQEGTITGRRGHTPPNDNGIIRVLLPLFKTSRWRVWLEVVERG